MFNKFEYLQMHSKQFPHSSKRVKKPAKHGTAVIRSRVVTDMKDENDLDEEEAEDDFTYEIVEECP